MDLASMSCKYFGLGNLFSQDQPGHCMPVAWNRQYCHTWQFLSSTSRGPCTTKKGGMTLSGQGENSWGKATAHIYIIYIIYYIYIYIFNVFAQPPNITGRGYGTKEGHGPRRLPWLSPGRSLAALAAGGALQRDPLRRQEEHAFRSRKKLGSWWLNQQRWWC